MSKPVLFVSFRPLERAENIKAIYDAYTGEKEHILSTDPDYVSKVLSGKYYVMVTDDFPSITPGCCIMIWHGIQGGKYIGLDQPGHPYYNRADRDKMTYIISAGIGAMPMWHSATGLDELHILPWGFPRTDAYIGKQKGDGNTILSGKRSYLFVPTFRDRGETPFPNIDWDYIDDTLTDDEIFAVKAHPWQLYHGKTDQIHIHPDNYRHIVTISPDQPSTPYLYDADVVITDYSSIMFDAYLLNKPVVLFEKTPGYVWTRGMYLDYPDQYCSRYAPNERDLIRLMRSAYKLTDTERKCVSKVAEACDGHACERICRMIKTANENKEKGWY